MKTPSNWRIPPMAAFATFTLLLALHACKETPLVNAQNLSTLPIDEGKTDDRMVIQVESRCAGELHDRPEIKINWQANADVSQKQRIDLTVYKDGFEAGRYTSFLVGDQKSGFSRLPSATGAGAKEDLLPALAKLKVDRVGKPQYDRGDQKSATQSDMEMIVTDIEPGLNYFVRLLLADNGKWVPGPKVKVVASTCPLDEFLEK